MRSQCGANNLPPSKSMRGVSKKAERMRQWNWGLVLVRSVLKRSPISWGVRVECRKKDLIPSGDIFKLSFAKDSVVCRKIHPSGALNASANTVKHILIHSSVVSDCVSFRSCDRRGIEFAENNSMNLTNALAEKRHCSSSCSCENYCKMVQFLLSKAAL